MAIGTSAGFKIHNEFLHTSLTETLTQASNAFNEASRGTIRLSSVSRRGDYVYETFFTNVDDLVSRRIASGSGSTDDVNDKALEQEEHIAVKINRKIGPVANTLDAFKKIQKGPFNENALNMAIGAQAAKAMQVDMLNSALRAARAALNAQAAVKYTVSSDGGMSTTGLINGLAKFGDAASRVACWVMHSKPFYDLVKDQINMTLTGVSDFNVATAMPITLNRPVLVTDSPSLVNATGSPEGSIYYTLGLVPNGVRVEDSEETTVVSEFVTGKENLIVRYQGDFAYNVGVQGFQWDTVTGGVNPTDDLVGTGANWDPVMSSYKDYAGVIIQSR